MKFVQLVVVLLVVMLPCETVGYREPMPITAPDALQTHEISRETSPMPEVEFFTVTAYCPCSACCGEEDGITASGTQVEAGRTIAMSGEYGFGTLVYIDELGWRTCEDRGSAINGKHIDVYFDTHQEALDFGVKELGVIIYDRK